MLQNSTGSGKLCCLAGGQSDSCHPRGIVIALVLIKWPRFHSAFRLGRMNFTLVNVQINRTADCEINKTKNGPFPLMSKSRPYCHEIVALSNIIEQGRELTFMMLYPSHNAMALGLFPNATSGLCASIPKMYTLQLNTPRPPG